MNYEITSIIKKGPGRVLFDLCKTKRKWISEYHKHCEPKDFLQFLPKQ